MDTFLYHDDESNGLDDCVSKFSDLKRFKQFQAEADEVLHHLASDYRLMLGSDRDHHSHHHHQSHRHNHSHHHYHDNDDCVSKIYFNHHDQICGPGSE